MEFSVIVSIINTIFVIVIGVYNIKSSKRDKVSHTKKMWFDTEVVSTSKIDEHLKKMQEILYSTSRLAEKCKRIDDAMLDFFYSSINYVHFIDADSCKKLKHDILLAVDELLLTVLYGGNTMSKREKEKVLKVYRIKFVYLFYELDMSIDK